MTDLQYRAWPVEPHARWIQAGHTFGKHLMEASRDYAFERVPENATPEERAIAQKAALDAIYGMMMLLDGVTAPKIDGANRIEYVLTARIIPEGASPSIEEFELAPDGDGLCMGYHYWIEASS